MKAQIYNEKREYPRAKVFIEKALSYHQETKQTDHLRRDYLTLSSINQNMGDYKAALEHYILYKTYDDSLQAKDVSKTVMRYEFEKKATALKNQQQLELNKKAMLANTTYGVLACIILFIGIGWYTFWLRNRKLHMEKEFLELQNREAELGKEAEAFKSRFLSNISHEFRTPLTLINGHLEILQNQDNMNKRRYNEMGHSSKRLLQLINQLLDLSKIGAGKYTLLYRRGNLLQEVQNYVQAFHSYAQERNIQLNTTVTFDARVKFAHRDFAYSSEALASIFNNLVSNALKFTPEGGNVNTTIDYLGGKLYIAIRDTGPGIPPKDTALIFGRFYQATQDENPSYEGSGIGLAIVKELAQLHHGNVEVANNEDGGCTFTVWLSEGKCEDSTTADGIETGDEQANIYTDPVIEGQDEEHKTIILVVEDQRELRKFIAENLREQYLILEASNGRQGVEIALEKSPDIIISDVMMPELDGFQLTKAIKSNEITSHIPIILLTAKTEQQDKIDGLEYGADDYLTKPFSIAELRLRVKNKIQLQEIIRQKYTEQKLSSQKQVVPELNLIDRNFIDKLTAIVEKKISVDVSLLASDIGLSTSQLTRKIKVLLGTTPANFILDIRMRMALKLLHDGYAVSEAAWKTGFEEPAYFSKVFKKHFGYLPSKAVSESAGKV